MSLSLSITHVYQGRRGRIRGILGRGHTSKRSRLALKSILTVFGAEAAKNANIFMDLWLKSTAKTFEHFFEILRKKVVNKIAIKSYLRGV